MRDLWHVLSHPTARLVDWWFTHLEGEWVCPCCGVKLIKGEARRFETLDEHVSDPNKEEYPLRDTWMCPTSTCKVHTTKAFYADMGGLYTSAEGVGQNIPSDALFSWEWAHHEQNAFWKSKLGKVFSFRANNLLYPFCWLGIHFPTERAWKDHEPFCGLCHKDLSKAYLKHPFLHEHVHFLEERQLPWWRQFFRSIV